MMHGRQQGFTLIELVVVIVILGILAAVALPKFIDLSTEANSAALQGVAGALSSANAVNVAGKSANSGKGQAISNCNQGASLLEGGTLPSGYSITAASITAGSTASCTLTAPGGSTTTFSLRGCSATSCS